MSGARRRVQEDAAPAAPAAPAAVQLTDAERITALEQLSARLERQIRSLQLQALGLVWDSRLIPRCGCNKFATRELRVENRHMLTCDYIMCDGCSPEHPLINHALTIITARPIYGSEQAAALAREANESLTVVGLPS